MDTRYISRDWAGEMQRAIETCLDCHRSCSENLTYCLETGGRRHEAEHLKILTDCAEICRLAAEFLIRGSDMHKHICAAASAVCDRCAESCENFPDDEALLQCADMCHNAGDILKDLAASQHHPELRPQHHH